MKRYFLYSIYTSLAAMILGLSACKTDHLVFPEAAGTEADEGTIDVIAKPIDINFVGEYDYGFTIKWPQISDKITKIIISYSDDGEDKTMEFTDFDEEVSIEMSEYREYSFSAVAYGEDDLVSKPAIINAQNGDLYIAQVVNSVQTYVSGSDVIMEWNNPLLRTLDFSVVYPTVEGDESNNLVSSTRTGNISGSGVFGDQMALVIKDSLGNKRSHVVKYGAVSALIDDSEKEGWTAEVSSNQEGDGGGAPALIDGEKDTFWHTPWSGEILPWPHYATITLDEERNIDGFSISLRHDNGSAAPKDIDFQISENGVDFVTVKSFVNTSITDGDEIRYYLDNAVTTKYVRLSFQSGFHDQWTNLGEISLSAPILGIVR